MATTDIEAYAQHNFSGSHADVVHATVHTHDTSGRCGVHRYNALLQGPIVAVRITDSLDGAKYASAWFSPDEAVEIALALLTAAKDAKAQRPAFEAYRRAGG